MPPGRVSLLVEMAKALERQVQSRVDPSSDIVTPDFESDFSGRLLLFHAMHDAALTKKTFEYFFRGACRAAGRTAEITENSVHPGEDVIVDGQKFSCKTEGGKSIRRDIIHISKFMEARWIRECNTGADFCRLTRSKVGDHLAHYERIVSFRSFLSWNHVDYELIEIPKQVLAGIDSLDPSDFSRRTKNGSSSATVQNRRGQSTFVLSLDGSVEKVTIRMLGTRFCQRHATWRVMLT
jgi:hypothetical protein